MSTRLRILLLCAGSLLLATVGAQLTAWGLHVHTLACHAIGAGGTMMARGDRLARRAKAAAGALRSAAR